MALTPRQLERNWTDGGVLHGQRWPAPLARGARGSREPAGPLTAGQQVLGWLGPPMGAMPCREGEPSLSSGAPRRQGLPFVVHIHSENLTDGHQGNQCLS